MKAKKQPPEGTKKSYPLRPYLVGLFVMVVALVVLSYLMKLRNKQELTTPTSPSAYAATETDVAFARL